MSTGGPHAFSVGDPVRVKAIFPPGHVRTPYYCRGKTGVVERVCGAFRNPEQLAYGNHKAEKLTLYRVHFKHTELWPNYKGPEHDGVELEIFEHWLESA
jgi:hypothetical protein